MLLHMLLLIFGLLLQSTNADGKYSIHNTDYQYQKAGIQLAASLYSGYVDKELRQFREFERKLNRLTDAIYYSDWRKADYFSYEIYESMMEEIRESRNKIHALESRHHYPRKKGEIYRKNRRFDHRLDRYLPDLIHSGYLDNYHRLLKRQLRKQERLAERYRNAMLDKRRSPVKYFRKAEHYAFRFEELMFEEIKWLNEHSYPSGRRNR